MSYRKTYLNQHSFQYGSNVYVFAHLLLLQSLCLQGLESDNFLLLVIGLSLSFLLLIGKLLLLDLYCKGTVDISLPQLGLEVPNLNIGLPVKADNLVVTFIWLSYFTCLRKKVFQE